MSDDSISLQPWDRQPGEPNRWYARFDRYRQLGPERSIHNVFNEMRRHRGLPKAKSAHRNWSVKARQWRWQERAEAWDEHERRLGRTVRARGLMDMAQRHTQEAKALQGMALKRLQALNPDDLSPALMLRILIDAAKLERLSQDDLVKSEGTLQADRDDESLSFEKIRSMSEEELVRIIVAGGGVVDDDGPGIPPPSPGST